jgi:hypothetical protein
MLLMELPVFVPTALEPVGSVPNLLAPASAADVATEPFAHLVRTSALPAADYATLADEFPPLESLAAGAAALGSNQAVRMNAAQVQARADVSPTWQRFFALHTSADYWLAVVRVFGPHLRAAFPTLEARVGRRFEDWRVTRRGLAAAADVRLDCQFVMNTPVTRRSSVKTPHVDKHDKIFSALFYVRAADDRTAGGDLDLYRWRRRPRFVKHRVLPADVERVATVTYAANTYVAFVNSPRAVHCVSPRDVTHAPRRYVNFIAEIPGRAFEPIQASRWHRWRHGRRDDDY